MAPPAKKRKTASKKPKIPSAHNHNATPFPLLSLAPEIRQQILLSLFQGSNVQVRFARKYINSLLVLKTLNSGSRPIWSILLSCRRMYTEGLSLFYSEVEACIVLWSEEAQRLVQRHNRKIAPFENVMLITPNFPFHDLEYVSLFPKLRHLTVNNGTDVSLRSLHWQFYGRLRDDQLFHNGADNLVNDRRTRPWVQESLTALESMRVLSNADGDVGKLSVTRLFSSECIRQILERRTYMYVDFELQLTDDGTFTLEYRYSGNESMFRVKQKPLDW